MRNVNWWSPKHTLHQIPLTAQLENLYRCGGCFEFVAAYYEVGREDARKTFLQMSKYPIGVIGFTKQAFFEELALGTVEKHVLKRGSVPFSEEKVQMLMKKKDFMRAIFNVTLNGKPRVNLLFTLTVHSWIFGYNFADFLEATNRMKMATQYMSMCFAGKAWFLKYGLAVKNRFMNLFSERISRDAFLWLKWKVHTELPEVKMED